MATIAVNNETRSSSSRMTRDGRKITYTLNVIQQPERARACGSGAKSSADRRPVDPPPIVELRVFDGEQDITFAYSAQFFLYATLENSRPMAQGRVPPAPNSYPVLTGTPVAGVAYLDRPSPAGYFIFPDLSVRHEGKYRLSFSLYEQHKHEADADAENPNDPNSARDNEPHVAFRLDVRSVPFTVYSAKKFPGLTESTQLSRMVAEQGCRVRIRRDVRMRRRENKVEKDWDGYEDETAYERAKRDATPSHYGPSGITTPQPADAPDRPRSVSNASVASYAMPPQRRPSIEQLPQQYQQQYSSPAVPPQQQQQAYPSYPQYPPQQQQQYQAQYPTQQPSYMQPGMMQPPQMPMQSPHGTYMGGYPMPPPQQHYAASPYEAVHQRTNSIEYQQDSRRASVPQQHSQGYIQNQMMNPYSGMDAYGRHQSMAQPMTQPMPALQPVQPRSVTPVPQVHPATALAPLKTQQLDVGKTEQPIHSPYATTPSTAMPMSSSSLPQTSASSGYYPNNNTMYQPRPANASKRTYGETFGEQPDQPLRQGARPTDVAPPKPVGGLDGADDDDGYEPPMEKSAMLYRRADGTERRRTVPVV